MTTGIQTLDSALQAIAAEREALQGRQQATLATVPTSQVPPRMPMPPLPRSPGIVDNLPPNLQSVSRLDVPHSSHEQIPLASQQAAASAGVKSRLSSVMMVAASVVVGAVVGVGGNYLMGSANQGGGGLLEKASLLDGATLKSKQNKISATDALRLNKSCTTLYQDLLTGRTKSVNCRKNTTIATTTEVTQFSSEQTSATVNPNKFTESLSTSRDKVTESLSAQKANSSGLGLESSGIKLKFKPRGIVKQFYGE